jgi:AmiR/NasT family two-component response regulator
MAGSRFHQVESGSLLDFATEIVMGRRGCTSDEALVLLRHAAQAHDMSVSDLALCVVADHELR